MGGKRFGPRVVAIVIGLQLVTTSSAAAAVSPYDLETYAPDELGKISPYAGFARRFVEAHGFYTVTLSSAERVRQLAPDFWQFEVPGYTDADPVEVCSAATGVQRRPGITLEQLQAVTDSYLAPGSDYEKIATREMTAIESRTVASLNVTAGKQPIRFPTWIGKNAQGVYLAVGVMPVPAGTIALACSGRSSTGAFNQLTSFFHIGQGVL